MQKLELTTKKPVNATDFSVKYQGEDVKEVFMKVMYNLSPADAEAFAHEIGDALRDKIMEVGSPVYNDREFISGKIIWFGPWTDMYNIHDLGDSVYVSYSKDTKIDGYVAEKSLVQKELDNVLLADSTLLAVGEFMRKNPVKYMRWQMRMTQEEFAKEYHIPQRTLKSWEVGERNAPEYVLHLLGRCVDSDYKEFGAGKLSLAIARNEVFK